MAGGIHAKEREATGRTRLPTPAWLLAAGITVLAVAWGYLVLLAIDFSTNARSGDASWWLLALACVGAVACLFAGLILLAHLLASLAVASSAEQQRAERPPGGRRAKR